MIVQIETNGSVSFAVLLPSTRTPLNSNAVQSVTNGTFMSSIFNVSLNMLNNDNNVTPGATNDQIQNAVEITLLDVSEVRVSQMY